MKLEERRLVAEPILPEDPYPIFKVFQVMPSSETEAIGRGREPPWRLIVGDLPEARFEGQMGEVRDSDHCRVRIIQHDESARPFGITEPTKPIVWQPGRGARVTKIAWLSNVDLRLSPISIETMVRRWGPIPGMPIIPAYRSPWPGEPDQWIPLAIAFPRRITYWTFFFAVWEVAPQAN